MSSMLTQEERELLNQLLATWEAFKALEELHTCDRQDFLAALHAAERVIMADPRSGGPVLRELIAREEAAE